MKGLKKHFGYRKQLMLWTLMAFAVITLMIFQGIQNQFNGCGVELQCFRRLLTSISYAPVVVPSIALLITLIPLFFTKEAVYRTWRKFSLWYIPIAFLLVYNTPTSRPGGFVVFGFDRQDAAMHFSILFLIISFLIIIIKSWKLRGKKA